jgi:hypothetical protein
VTTTRRRKFHLSLSGLSIAFALGLALWECYLGLQALLPSCPA